MCEEKPPAFLGLGIVQSIIAFVALCLLMYLTFIFSFMPSIGGIGSLILLYLTVIICFSGGIMCASSANMEENLIVATMAVNLIACVMSGICFFLVVSLHIEVGLCEDDGSDCPGFLVPLLFFAALLIFSLTIASFAGTVACCPMGVDDDMATIMTAPRPTMVQPVYSMAPAVVRPQPQIVTVQQKPQPIIYALTG